MYQMAVIHIFQMPIKYSNNFYFPPKFTQIGLKIHHLATLATTYVVVHWQLRFPGGKFELGIKSKII
jgi:hypothetical protein